MDVEKSLEYFIQCSLCGEQFKEAYILNCLHTFCEKCLKNKKRDSNKVICEKCQQESRVEGIKRNYFIENNLAARLLEVLQEGNPPCGNCAKFNRLLKYCEECREYLCDACVYCHENTKLTRDHNLLSMDKFEKNLMARGRNRAVFCRIHEDKIAEQYCRSCQETICRGCEKHREHLAASLAEVYSMEIPNVQLLLKNAIAKVRDVLYCILKSEMSLTIMSLGSLPSLLSTCSYNCYLFLLTSYNVLYQRSFFQISSFDYISNHFCIICFAHLHIILSAMFISKQRKTHVR